MIDPARATSSRPIYVRKVEKKNGELWNVEFDKFENVKDPGKSREVRIAAGEQRGDHLAQPAVGRIGMVALVPVLLDPKLGMLERAGQQLQRFAGPTVLA